ncbi:MAG: histidine kinase [Acidimicrobiia bacterium]|nr:histidine kinase [Acidimicrobiia bacterium]
MSFNETVREPQSRKRSIVSAWVWAALLMVISAAAATSLISSGNADIDAIVWLILLPLYTGLGLLTAIRRPGNRVAWILLTVASYVALTGASIAQLGEPSIPPDPVTIWDALAIVFQNTGYFILLIIPLLLFFYVFPTGRFLTPRWRWAGWFATLATVAMIAGEWFLKEIGPTDQDWVVTNPFGFVEDRIEDGSPLGLVFGLTILALVLGAIPAMVVRYRRADPLVRAQIKWVVFASVTGVLALLGSLLLRDVLAGWVTTALFFLLVTVIPVSITLAITRHRLYDIDVVISRTVTLAILVTFITLVYALVVAGIGRLVGAESDGLALPIAATALVAIAFEPARVRAQKWANRMVYGSRATPYEVLREITRSMGRSGPDGDILARLAELLREGTGAERATVWLGQEGEMAPAASSPTDAEPGASPVLDSPNAFPVVHDDEVVGALEVVKERGSTMSSSERSLAADLAGSAGAVLGYQRLNRSLQQRAADLEESRARLLGVQANERRRLERDLHEGAEQFIVALKVKLGVAARLADKQGAEEMKATLDGLTEEAQAALDDVQALAKGIYPPVLESDGLVPAISALAGSTPVEVQFNRDGVGRYPSDLEAAVYFGISEAVTNAVKHASPPIRIEMKESDGELHFSVTDQGPGFEVDRANLGSGLENMADRLESVGGTLQVISSEGGFTEIRGAIPY